MPDQPRLKQIIHTDCRHYRGNLPCRPHKLDGVHCDGCTHYDRLIGNILIIKLGAMGDVLRTTPLLHCFKRDYPHHRIHWVTDFPDTVPHTPWVDKVYRIEPRALIQLDQMKFSALYCLDKDAEAAALAERFSAQRRYGYRFRNDTVVPVAPVDAGEAAHQAALHKWITGLFDDDSKANTLSYQQEIFAICGYEFKGEEYIVPAPVKHPFTLPEKGKRIGLNTGCGGRWSTRLWLEEYWVELVKRLQQAGHSPVILGGPEEDEKNKRLHNTTGAPYYGTMPLAQFDSLLGDMDVVVTAVTMAMHLAIGRQRRLVLFNNIFNKHEFELYSRGEILEPEPACKCYYANDCAFGGCMQNLSVERVFEAVLRQINAVA